MMIKVHVLNAVRRKGFRVKSNFGFNGRALSFLMIIALLMTFVEVQAEGPNAPTFETYYRFESILLTQNLSVRGNRLCHDNLYIYFKDRAACLEASSPVDCDGNLEIVPIREHEKIYARSTFKPNEIPKVLNRVFRVPLEYRVKVYKQPVGGNAEYQGEENGVIPLCCDSKTNIGCENIRPTQKEGVVGDFRYAHSTKEAKFIRAMVDSGLDFVTSPRGGVDILENLGFDDLQDKNDFDIKKPVVSTPYCDDDVNSPIILLGGEDSGGGGAPSTTKPKPGGPRHPMSFDEIDEFSRQLYLHSLDLEAPQPKINFSCTRVWEI